MLQSMGSQRVRYDWATEQQQYLIFCAISFITNFNFKMRTGNHKATVVENNVGEAVTAHQHLHLWKVKTQCKIFLCFIYILI